MLDKTEGPKLTKNSNGAEILAHMTFYAENISRNPNRLCYDLSDGEESEWVNLNEIIAMAAEEVAEVPGRHPFGAKFLDWWVELHEITGELSPTES